MGKRRAKFHFLNKTATRSEHLFGLVLCILLSHFLNLYTVVFNSVPHLSKTQGM